MTKIALIADNEVVGPTRELDLKILVIMFSLLYRYRVAG